MMGWSNIVCELDTLKYILNQYDLYLVFPRFIAWISWTCGKPCYSSSGLYFFVIVFLIQQNSLFKSVIRKLLFWYLQMLNICKEIKLLSNVYAFQ